MATTHIHAITKTVEKALDYCQKDKSEVLKENEKDAIKDVISYATKDKTGETVFFTLNSTQNCTIPNDPIRSFQDNIKRNRGKLRRENPRTKSGREVLAWHLWQSFETVIDPRMANEIGCKLAKEVFSNYPVTISTHTNTDNTHNHLIICAWDLDGRKWNDCHETKRLIRRVSDQLCREYGLQVLEKTQDMHLKKYRDKNGKIRYFEATDRKIQKIKERSTNFDVNNYRNTAAYEKYEENRLTNMEVVKNDIDRLLPVVRNYEELLEKLRELQYVIKDKKADGSWRKYVTFIPPTADRGVRDSALDKDGFYCRVNLESYLLKAYEERKKESPENKKQYVYHEHYKFGTTNINEVDLDYRLDKDGLLVKRTEPERVVVGAIKDQYIRLQHLQVYSNSDVSLKIKRQNEVIQRIQDGFRNLEFLEEKGILSMDQLEKESNGIKQNYRSCMKELDKLINKTKELENLNKIPQKIESLQRFIDENEDDEIYQKTEMDIDTELLRNYKSMLRDFKMDTKEGYQNFEQSILKLQDKIKRLFLLRDYYEVEIERYETCRRIFQNMKSDREISTDEKKQNSMRNR